MFSKRIENFVIYKNSSLKNHFSGINLQNIENSYEDPLPSPPFPSPPKYFDIQMYSFQVVSSPLVLNILIIQSRDVQFVSLSQKSLVITKGRATYIQTAKIINAQIKSLIIPYLYYTVPRNPGRQKIAPAFMLIAAPKKKEEIIHEFKFEMK